MTKPQRFFITSSGTGIGKTLVTSMLSYQLLQMGKTVCVQKPIVTGWDVQAIDKSDTGILLQSCGDHITEKNINRVSPWRFTKPLSPHLAAEAEGKSIDVEQVVNYSKQSTDAEYLLVEGVGGAMVPLTYDYHSLQWMQALNFPAIVVVGCYLGAMSHALTTLTAIKNYGVPVAGIVVSDANHASELFDPTIKTLQQFTHLPVVGVPYIPKSVKEPFWQVASRFTDFIKLIKS